MAQKIADTTSLTSAVTNHHNATDPDSIDPNLPHDTLEWIFTDPTQVHTTGLIFLPWPYKHEPWHECQQKYALPQSNQTVKLHFSSVPAILAGQGDAELSAELTKIMEEECIRHKLGNVSVRVVSGSGSGPQAQPHAFVSFFNELSAAKFAELTNARSLGGWMVTKSVVVVRGSTS